jgi:hypothetical protein
MSIWNIITHEKKIRKRNPIDAKKTRDGALARFFKAQYPASAVVSHGQAGQD